MRRTFVLAALVVCANLVAGCGGSRHLSPAAERAAIRAAQRQDDNLRIFPTRPRTIRCKIPRGGGLRTGSDPGRCTTKVSPHGSGAQVEFIQRARIQGQLQTGDWIYDLDGKNRFVSFHPRGWLPQAEP